MEITEKAILRCLLENYRLSGSLKRLPGENLNYLLTGQQGQRYVIKIVDQDMPKEATEVEFLAMEYANSAGLGLDLPTINKNLFGNLETGIIIHNKRSNRLRVLSFLPGNTLDSIPDISIKVIKNVGFATARFHQAMQGFDHPAAHRSHRWNLVDAGQHRAKIKLLETPEKCSLLEWGFDQWERVRSSLKSLPWQFVHGDLNPENLMVDGDRVTGLVDFGDACFNPVACDLAIALAYPMMEVDKPLEAMEILLSGYRQGRELSRAEHQVLLPLVCGRLATSIAVSTARRNIDPDNPNWFGGETRAWNLLRYIKEKTHSNALF